QAEVISLVKKEGGFIIKTNEGNDLISKSVIIASGAIENKLRIKGEKELTNRGVSSCAICDGFLFRGKEVVVVGGGYSALETALYMSNIASRVYLIHRRDNFRAEKAIVERAEHNPKISFLLNAILTEIQGKETVEKVVISNLLDHQKSELSVHAVFPCIGLSPFS
ncbi:19288_t:CDS:1, partial [Funneliformis geosporum]